MEIPAEVGALNPLATRQSQFLRPRVAQSTEVVQGDVLEPVSLKQALEGVHTAYYLVHSMHSGGGFHEKDREAARNFGLAAAQAGGRRIIYLGELGDQSCVLSAHLRSRHEVGEVLRAPGVPTIEFRASTNHSRVASKCAREFPA